MSAVVDMMRRARAVVLRRGAPPEDADDIVQEAFARLEAHTRAHEVRSREAFLVNAAVNISIDQARRRRRAPFEGGAEVAERVADAAPRPDEVVWAQQKFQRMTEGLMKLSPKARAILLAQRVEGLSYAEIARREGMSLAAVEKQITRAVTFMLKWMEGW